MCSLAALGGSACDGVCYYDPTNHRFINADGLASTGQGFLGTNMFAYCRNNPIHRTDKSGNYDRDEAIEYAKKWYDDANTNDYQFFGGRGGDCTNFTSQCLFAGGIKKTKGWYCHKSSWLNPVATFFSLLINKTPYCWSYSKSWKFADDQFKFFSSKDNGIINGSVLKITSKDELKNVASYCNVQKGDLLYFASGDSEDSIYHSTIISSVSNGDIFYAAHSGPNYDQPLSEKSFTTVFIVRISDDA